MDRDTHAQKKPTRPVCRPVGRWTLSDRHPRPPRPGLRVSPGRTHPPRPDADPRPRRADGASTFYYCLCACRPPLLMGLPGSVLYKHGVLAADDSGPGMALSCLPGASKIPVFFNNDHTPVSGPRRRPTEACHGFPRRFHRVGGHVQTRDFSGGGIGTQARSSPPRARVKTIPVIVGITSLYPGWDHRTANLVINKSGKPTCLGA